MLGKPARFEFERRFLVSGGEIRRQGEEKCKKPNSPDSVLRRMTLSLYDGRKKSGGIGEMYGSGLV